MSRLARTLVRERRSFPIEPATPNVTPLEDEFGTMRVVDSDRAILTVGRQEVTLCISRPLREAIVAAPQALWIITLSPESGKSSIVPFTPPRAVRIDGEIPVVIPDGVELGKKLDALHLRTGDDLIRRGSEWIGGANVAFIGQRTLAALDAADACALTWWLPSGDALECVLDGEPGRARLQIVDVVRQHDVDSARTGPCVRVVFGTGARLPLVGADGAWANEADVLPLRASRPPLFDAWAQYRKLEREARDERLAQRIAHPLAYTDARQDGRGWTCTVHFESDPARTAWFGTNEGDRHEQKLDQRVALQVDGSEVGFFLVRTGILLDPRRVQLSLAPDREHVPLPPQGRLEARENPGDRTQEARERDAATLLTSGSAACPALWDIFTNPSRATPPEERMLRIAARGRLDAHQERAVRAIVNCVDVVAIQGPPGTGKTTVIIEALHQIAALPGERPARVLISSVQNEAVRNLVERSSGTEGILVSYLRRESENEDEARAFVRSQEAQRAGVIAALEERWKGYDQRPALAALDEADRALSELRLSLMTRTDDVVLLISRTREAATAHRALLSPLLVDAAMALAPPTSTSEATAAPGPTIGNDRPLRSEDVEAWWRACEASWPAEARAATGDAAERVITAYQEPEGLRRDMRLRRAWPDLQAVLLAAPPLAKAPLPLSSTDAGREAAERIRAWASTAVRELAAARRLHDATPAAAALGFLNRLREDPAAWTSILQRHGLNTAATCSMSAKARDAVDEPFDWVIIDEAGRASPFEILIPAVQGRRVVLIGDQRQLPPTVDELLARRSTEQGATDVRYDTLFGSLFDLLPDACCVRLATQYRMHEQIGDLVNELFYVDHDEDLDSFFRGARAAERLPQFGAFKNDPLVWIDVPAGGARCKLENAKEAQYTLAVLRIYARAGARPEDVAVIVPYGRQRAMVSQLLRDDPDLHPFATRVLTFDAVQGREYPVAIVSTVRNDGTPGFLTSPNRVNVAISRAQRQLVVLGNREAFMSPLIRERAQHLTGLADRLKSRQHRVEIR